MIILAFDPGTVSMGYCVGISNGKKYQLLEAGMIQHTVHSLAGCKVNVKELSKSFLKEVRKIVKKHNVEYIIAERFMNRGARKGSTGECVGIMLGLLLSLPVEVELVTASQWKNEWNRRVMKLDDFYTQIDKKNHHRIDACLMFLYKHYKLRGKKAFENIKLKRCIKRLKSLLNS